MKNKLPGITLAIVMILSITACSLDSGDSGVSPYTEKTLTVKNEQVWEHNLRTGKPSEMYAKSTENSDIRFFTGTKSSPKMELSQDLCSGEIKNGKLSFTVGELEPGNLLAWNSYLDDIFPEWGAVAIAPAGTRGNIITLLLSDSAGDKLSREKVITTGTSFGLEEILHVYVDRDCIITGDHGEGMIPGDRYYFTANTLNLSLKEGWNLLCRKEVFASDQDGRDAVSMEIKDLVDFRWAVW